MKRLFTKKRIAIFAAIPVLAVGGTVAYAFWTTGGTGSGTAATGAPASGLVVTVSAPTSLVLGSSSPVDIVSVDNPYSYHVDLKGDTASIDSGTITCKIGVNTVSVDDSWFTLSTGTITDTTVYPASTTTTNGSPPASGLTLTMNDLPTVDQDACQGATVALTVHIQSETGN